ncbi:hypothetical protein FOZ60_017422 [Perkinsus olseni]|uniref:PNPLA domain-containing protein n=1 Tax=Perkinsus olseni TaxID=32597 RepID=A0A7J6P3V0_PEROL|nr:hypothetical protein FOZ60_017422 [Perkinsus olseni]
MFRLLHALRWNPVAARLPRTKVDLEVSALSVILASLTPRQSYRILKALPAGPIVIYALSRSLVEEGLIVLRQSLLAVSKVDPCVKQITVMLVGFLRECSWPEPSPIIGVIADYYSLRLGDPWLTIAELRALLPPSSFISVLVTQCLCLIIRGRDSIARSDLNILLQMALDGHDRARAILYASLSRPSMAVLPSYDRLVRILTPVGVRRPQLGVEDLLASPDGEGCFRDSVDALRLFNTVNSHDWALAAALAGRVPFEVARSTLAEAVASGTLEGLYYLNAVAEGHPNAIDSTFLPSSADGSVERLLLRRLQLLLAPSVMDGDDTATEAPSTTNGFLSSFGSWFRRAIGGSRARTDQPLQRCQRGIRILALDGGGTRSLLTITILKALAKYLPDQRIGRYFDLVVGTSAGGLVALGIGCMNLPLKMSSSVARDISIAAFSKGGTLGSVEKLLRILIKGEKHDSRAMTNYLRDVYGRLSMVDTSALCVSNTKVAVVTALTNVAPPEPFLFRNYSYGPEGSGRYQGDRSVPIYQCARATTAAPVYFAPVVLEDGTVIQDGAMVANNPAHLALHEAARVFPNRRVECLVSIGTGRVPIEDLGATYTAKAGLYSITRDLLAMVYSATSTEVTAHILGDILDSDVYYRLQPDLPRAVELDEADDESMDELIRIAEEYVARSEVDQRLRRIARKLFDSSLSRNGRESALGYKLTDIDSSLVTC